MFWYQMAGMLLSGFLVGFMVGWHARSSSN